ncbi:MAG: hypothetical protein K8R85_01625 [Bacteroidetes bacterium]|nr:hypothetical protein [Bacteroidota bacterium]
MARGLNTSFKISLLLGVNALGTYTDPTGANNVPQGMVVAVSDTVIVTQAVSVHPPLSETVTQ